MMPPDNTPASTKDQVENQGGSDSKKATRPTPPEQGLKCPRCDSPNTKFCYYNNYSLTQPRHFCKTCRRYWTNGGALRNVPIGGGCRKNKKVKTSSSSSSSSLSRLSCDSNKDSASSPSELAGLRFLQLGGLPLPFPARLHHHQPSFTTGIYNQFSSFGEVSVSATTTCASATSASSSFQLDPSGGTSSDSLIGLNYPFSSSTGSGLINGAIQGMNSMNMNSSSLASSIESLSSINQDLHWKLQQQRLAMMFGGGDNNQKDKDSSCSVSLSHQVINLEKPQPILFQNLEISKPDLMFQAGNSRKEGPSGDAPIECFFGNSYNSSVMTPATTTSSVTVGNGHENANNNNWSSGVHAWGDVQQQPYSTLP